MEMIGRKGMLGLCSLGKPYSLSVIEPIGLNSSRISCVISLFLAKYLSKSIIFFSVFYILLSLRAGPSSLNFDVSLVISCILFKYWTLSINTIPVHLSGLLKINSLLFFIFFFTCLISLVFINGFLSRVKLQKLVKYIEY